ncbi:hypothetical protein O9993_10470 [Vibrio lentus]|nr:hypothetical protein [Vibrio lentus]
MTLKQIHYSGLNEVRCSSRFDTSPDVNPDMITMIATSAALAISGAPFNGPYRCCTCCGPSKRRSVLNIHQT